MQGEGILPAKKIPAMAIDIRIGNDLKKELLFSEKFTDNTRNWEETDIESEYAAVGNNGYTMENRGDTNWTFYHLPMPLLKEDHFSLQVRLVVKDNGQEGEFGIAWGFGKKPELLNRFALSSDGRRCTVCCFEKNHRRIFHAFHALLRPVKRKEYQLSITKAGAYYLFRLNGELLYIGHEHHFTWQGNRMGFYVEPGLKIVAKEFVLERLVEESGDRT